MKCDLSRSRDGRAQGHHDWAAPLHSGLTLFAMLMRRAPGAGTPEHNGATAHRTAADHVAAVGRYSRDGPRQKGTTVAAAEKIVSLDNILSISSYCILFNNSTT